MSIDQRSAAFLHEMGITPLWTPRALQDLAPAPAPAPAPEALAPAAPAQPARAEPAPPRAPSEPDEATLARRRALETPPVSSHFGPRENVESAWGETPPAPPATDEEIARMDWAALKTAISNCTRCDLCKSGKKAVQGSGAQQALWLVAAGASTASDEKERRPLSGEAGKLLDNMLAAVELARTENVWVTNLIKCRPSTASGGDRAPTADEAAACRPYLERELALTGAAMVLTLGQIAANALQNKPLQAPLAGTRGSVHSFQSVPLVATLHPGELLRRGADKALAWADLCLARTHDGRPG
ncbi:MAG TPA: uracil-DNA glycosylase [Telluria sp.]|jgi:DNA polymerase